tara:strand:+ start:386 stop:634 length:249 start_codon:yes stop_codon:yes gene_type:complete
MTESVYPLLAALIFGFFALITGKRFSKKKKEVDSKPPENTAASAAREDIQQTFEEEVERQEKALNSEDPAGDLAALGNARKR